MQQRKEKEVEDPGWLHWVVNLFYETVPRAVTQLQLYGNFDGVKIMCRNKRAIVGNCAFPKDKMRKQDESKKHRKYEESASDSGKKWAKENEK